LFLVARPALSTFVVSNQAQQIPVRMKYTIYHFLLLFFLGASTFSLPAQCTVEVIPSTTLNCAVSQVTLLTTANPTNVSYEWSGPGGFTSSVQNPTVFTTGPYSVTITDPTDGCTATTQVVVTGNFTPPIVAAAGAALTCFAPTVTIVSTVNIPNAIFQWSGPGISPNIQNLQNPPVNVPGPYTVTVTNSVNACTGTAVAIVTQNIAVPVVTATGGTITCNQSTVTLSASSITTGVTFSWTGPYFWGSNQQNPIVNNPGTFTVVVTAQNGCTSSQTVTVDSSGNFPQINNPVLTAPTCAGLANGAISLTLSGGTAPYTFAWTGPNSFTSNLPNIANLPGGIYMLTVTDAIGCKSIRSLILTAPAPIVITQTGGNPVNCYGGSTGSLSLGVTGGTLPYAFFWNNGVTTANLQNLVAGNYLVTVTDASGCVASSPQILIGQPPQIFITPFICESSITAQVSGGFAPYQYGWSDGETGPTANPQQPGSYMVTVQDARGCSVSSTIIFSSGNNPPCTRIIGRVVLDENIDCLPDPLEIGLGAWYVKAEGPNGIFYGVTDAIGRYDIRLIPGNYTVFPISPAPSYQVCLPITGVVLQSGDSIPIDFAAQGANPDCPAMTVDLSTGILRRCFSNNFYTLHYCNNSPAPAPDAYILLTLDPLLNLVSAQRPYTALGDNVFRFNLDSVAPFECSQFKVYVNVSCTAALGQTHCSEAHIYPDTLCNPPNPLWSGAEVAVRAECATDSLHFILKNTGTGPMTNPLNYIVIEDGIMGLQGNASPLLAGDSMLVGVLANGSTWRMEAQQVDYFPGQSMPVLSVEGCSTIGSFSTGYVQQFATNDADAFLDVDCTANIGSYDPNDKQGLPLGYGPEHYIRPGTDIEYLVRFQNTGTDTAFTVIVRDTLISWLDPATVIPGGSSHHYTFGITGNGILIFDFQNILLPDSNVNEPASHGFLKFRVSQRATVPLETDILNRAAIYFDFNEPIITNTTVHRVGEWFLMVGLWQPAQPAYRVQIAPHPLRDASWLTIQGLPEPGNYRLHLYDATGQLVQTLGSTSPRFQIEKADKPAGLYLFRIEQNGVLVGSGTLVAQ